MLRALVVAVWVAATLLSAAANDTMVTLGAGGLVPVESTQVVVESEDLQISVHQITIHYRFRNTTDKDIDAEVGFPLPPIDGGGLYYEPMALPRAADWNFVDFNVSSNGQPVATRAEVRAFSVDREITAHLRSMGLSGSVLLEPLNAELSKLPGSQRSQLEKENLIAPGQFNPPLESGGKTGWWATWSMRVQFHWRQRFPAKSTVELVQSYRPVVGGSYITTNSSGIEVVHKYCGESNTVERVKQILKRHPMKDWTDGEVVLFDREIQYILTTANNWRGPVANFRLSVVADSPEDIVLTCMPGLKRVSPTRYELLRSNFRPDKELDLLILQENRE